MFSFGVIIHPDPVAENRSENSVVWGGEDHHETHVSTGGPDYQLIGNLHVPDERDRPNFFYSFQTLQSHLPHLGRCMLPFLKATVSRPTVTCSLVGGTLGFCGDVTAQAIERTFLYKDRRWDMRRSLSVSTFGFCWGAVGHHWYKGLDAWASRRFTPKTIPFVISKTSAELLLMSPICSATFFFTVSVLEGHGVPYAIQKIKRNTVSAWLTDCSTSW
eukprot:g82062.t1